MALENKAQKTKREALEALPRIVSATQSEIGYTFCTPEIVTYLEKNGLAEGNAELTNEHGAIACRATQKGVETAMSNKPAEETAATAAPPMQFEIETVPLPAAKRGGPGVGNTKYPFDKLEVGQSFFVPATAEKPEPWKSLASTVTSATARFDELVTNEDGSPKMRTNRKGNTVQEVKHTRVFVIRKDKKGDVEGARIGRTA